MNSFSVLMLPIFTEIIKKLTTNIKLYFTILWINFYIVDKSVFQTLEKQTTSTSLFVYFIDDDI